MQKNKNYFGKISLFWENFIIMEKFHYFGKISLFWKIFNRVIGQGSCLRVSTHNAIFGCGLVF
jgi:hypothetical protein